ncbi:MAG: aminoacyl-tRNA hydrolase [Endomicrobium sp.]|jgi:PTH1 family peptidyl-tRNA hydrolase|nr:aminoacyl-tRNA hydrolase [Endomicrobium sp.]
MSKYIKLFVGLGNPGEKYENTRHNLGFLVLDKIATSKHFEFMTWRDMASVSFCSGFDYNKIWLLKPITFMNISGAVVAAFAKYYKISPEEIFIFYDDFSIPLGEYKIKVSGSGGGHNGVKSIIEHLHANNFPRMKLGIGPLPKFVRTADFVLSRFTKEDKEKINLMKGMGVNIFDKINILGLDKAISEFSNKKRYYDRTKTE